MSVDYLPPARAGRTTGEVGEGGEARNREGRGTMARLDQGKEAARLSGFGADST